MTKVNKVALIREITGEDCIYLAELLLEKNYFVHGLKKLLLLYKTKMFDHLYKDP